MIIELRRIDPEQIDLEEAIMALAAAKITMSEFGTQNVPTPDWLKERTEQLVREVKNKRRDYLARELIKARARKQTLKTAEEKRAETDAEIARLEAELGK